jgi:alkaline phosphatase D
MLSTCGPAGDDILPRSSPFPSHAVVSHGVAVGDVTPTSAVVWFRTIGPAMVRVEWSESPQGLSKAAQPRRQILTDGGVQSLQVTTMEEYDFTATVVMQPLRSATEYRYRIVAASEVTGGEGAGDTSAASGRFHTAPEPTQAVDVSILWSADLGGQQHCRRGEAGYPILDQMAKVQADFSVFLGDLIYADGRCPSPPNISGGDFTADTLDQFRGKHRYQRGATALQRFLSLMPVYVTWDDHEVRNNFSGLHEPLMPIGRQAMLEYWPIAVPAEEPTRLHRRFQWGRSAELFLLDTRQYRNRNADQDGPAKTMLGRSQREWLIEGLMNSTAVWKIVGTSVPLSIPKGGTLNLPGNDSWARGADGTGFFTELSMIVQTVLAKKVRNLVWLAADVHYAQANRYDVDQDGETDFYEFICGPLAAASGLPVPLDPILHPTTVYTEAEFASFGLLRIRHSELTIEIRDEDGKTHFAATFHRR